MSPRRSFACPHCGAAVARGAAACAECGSDAGTGWSEEASAWAGDLPTGYDDEDDDFDYEETLRNEGLAADGRPGRAVLARRRTLAIVLLLIACLLLWLIRR